MNRPPRPTGADPIPFVDLASQRAVIADRIDAAIRRVLEHGAFIMGPEVIELESQLAAYCGVRHAVSCASGTVALQLVLMAKGIGPGDAVFVPGFSFPAPAEAAALLGATPVFVDVVPDTFTIDPDSLAETVAEVERQGSLRASAVVAVDLYGHPAAYPALRRVVEDRGMFLVGDAAQSFGASLGRARVGTLADVSVTSFYPAKTLGCYGDGGCVFTEDDDLAAVIRSLRTHGEGSDRNAYARIGLNGRLDTLQAAVLIEKLAILDDELSSRERIAERYNEALRGVAGVPAAAPEARPAWGYYTLVLDRRDEVAARLAAQGIPTAVYYPKPLDRQPAYRAYAPASAAMPAAEWLAERVLSLPMHPYLDTAVQDRIVDAVKDAVSA